MTQPRPPIPSTPGEHRLALASSVDGTLQPSCIYLPIPSPQPPSRLPLVVCLHGMGADETTWFAATPIRDMADKFGVITACPFGRGNHFYRGRAGQDVLDLVDHLVGAGLADPDRVFLIGHSMGGFGTWWIALGAPDRFAGIFPWSGFHPAGELAAAQHLGPGLVHSGDDEVVSIAWTEAAASELTARAIAHDFHPCDGYGHASRMIGDYLDEALESMMSRTRTRRPTEIRLAGRHPLRLAAWWLASLGTGYAINGDIVELEAELLRPWEHGLGPDDPARSMALLRIHCHPLQAVALHTLELTTAAGGPVAVEMHDPQSGRGARIAGSDGHMLVIVPPDASPQSSGPAAQDRFVAADNFLLIEADGSPLGNAPDRAAVTRLARERLTELGPLPPRLRQLRDLSGQARTGQLARWMVEAANWGLDNHPTILVLPEGSLILPDSGPMDSIDLLESYVRPEEFLGIYFFPDRASFDNWMAKPRPFPLQAFEYSEDHLDPSLETSPNSGPPAGLQKHQSGMVRAVIPLALGAGAQLETVAGYDSLTPEADPEISWHGPGSGWPIGVEGQIVTPGILALSGVLGSE